MTTSTELPLNQKWERAYRDTVRVLSSSVPGRGGPVPIRDYLPLRPQESMKPFLWIHGGGFYAGSLDQGESHAPALAIAASGRRVRTVDYRLAPKLPAVKTVRGISFPLPESHNAFPAGLHDVIDAFSDMCPDHNGFVGGASAGANLTAALALTLIDEQQRPPLGVILAYGLFHNALPADAGGLRSELRRQHRLKGRLLFNDGFIDTICRNYLGPDAEPRLAAAFPALRDQVTGFPPTLMVDAEIDTLRASSRPFRDLLIRDGVDVEYMEVGGAFHGFLEWRNGRSARVALQAMMRWMAQVDQT